MRRLRQAYWFVRDVSREFVHDNGSLVAAAIAFYGLLSVIPLLLLGIGAMGYVLGSQRAFSEVASLIREYIPVGTEELRANLDAIRQSSGVVSGVGLLGLLWSGSQIFVTLQYAMNIALDATSKPNYIVTRLRAVVLVMVSGLLLASSLGITWSITAARAFDIRIAGFSTNSLTPVWDLLVTLVPIFISVIMFFIVYKLLPTVEMGIKGPLIAGVTAGLLFELAKWVFGWYAANFGNFTAVYGSIGGVIVLVLWIYYVSVVTLIGAEVASVYRQHEREGARA